MSAWAPFLAVGPRPNTSDIVALKAWYAAAIPLLNEYASQVFSLLYGRGFSISVTYDTQRDYPYMTTGWGIGGTVTRNGITAGFLMQELTPLYYSPDEYAGKVEMDWQREQAYQTAMVESQSLPVSSPDPAVVEPPPAPAPGDPQPILNEAAAVERAWQRRRGRYVPFLPARAVGLAMEALFR